MEAWEILLAVLALFGHAALWIGVFNRLHAAPFSCRTINLMEKVIFLAILGAPGLWLWARWDFGASLLRPGELGRFWLLWAYAVLCWAIALGPGLLWLLRPISVNPSDVLLSNDSTFYNVAAELPEPLLLAPSTQWQGAIPGNQILTLEVNHKTLSFPGLPPRLNGLTITHISDLHFTGKIARAYFEFVMEQANRLESDLVMVTGDIVDTSACIAWIPETLGRLRSRGGVYGVLGNHDKRIRDVAALRLVLHESGVTLLGGRWIETTVRGARLVLAGDERPWFSPGPDLRAGPLAAEAFRILLSHTPDQYAFAQEQGFLLMLAGHNHGGQIRLPMVGPLVVPSRYGVKYASGVYREGPTVLHVSRGIGGLQPLRFNCPPELTQLELRG